MIETPHKDFSDTQIQNKQPGSVLSDQHAGVAWSGKQEKTWSRKVDPEHETSRYPKKFMIEKPHYLLMFGYDFPIATLPLRNRIDPVIGETELLAKKRKIYDKGMQNEEIMIMLNLIGN